MEPFRLPSEDKITTAYDKGKETVAAFFYEMFVKMTERIRKLEDQTAKNSSNSGKPPPVMDWPRNPKAYDMKVARKAVGSRAIQAARS